MKTKNNSIHPLLKNIQAGETPSLDAFIEAFGNQLPLLYELQHTQQDSEWHAEGNVYIHTKMVLQEVYKLLEDQADNLSQSERFTLILAAVFHDIAKPICTKVRSVRGQERIISPRHADKGRSYLAYALLDFGIDAKTVRQIMAIVGHHHDPKQLVVKDKPISQYKRLARLAPLHMLYWLEQADMRGRLCKDLEEQLDILEMFKLISEEEGLWNTLNSYSEWEEYLLKETVDLNPETQSFVVASAIHDFEACEIYTPQEAISRSYTYRSGFSNLIICFGPSGSGKSTWIEKNYPEYTIVSLDRLREELTGKREDQSKNGQVLQFAKEQIKDCLRKHQNVIWDATSLIKSQRDQIIQLGLNYHAKVTLALFHKSMISIHQNNSDRAFSVPDTVLEKQFRTLEFPYIDEAHQVIYID